MSKKEPPPKNDFNRVMSKIVKHNPKDKTQVVRPKQERRTLTEKKGK